MKRFLLCLALGAAVACPSLSRADDSATNTPPPGPPPGEGGPGGEHGGPGMHHMDFLTDAERAELKKAHDAAVAADPSLKTEDEKLHQAMEASREAHEKPSEELHAEMKAFRDKMDAAMIKADPAVAPIIEKIKAHHKRGPGGDGPPPPPSDT